jgi:hypothetical protein
MTCASYKPRLLTSFISGQMEACIGIYIVTVLVGQLRERVLLWYVLIPLAVDKEDITSCSLNHFYTVIYSAITVLKHCRYVMALLHPIPCEFMYTVATTLRPKNYFFLGH